MITPVIADHVEDAVERAESGYEALAVELDTPGGLDFAMRAIVRRLPRSRDELSRHDWLTVLEAGCALGRFCADPWLVDAPRRPPVVAMLYDRVVPTPRQLKLAHDIPGATLHTTRAGHSGCVSAPERFVTALLDACDSVRARLGRARAPAAA
ncbi:MAG: hypothetical protein ACRDZ1_19410 [Acidimicrobiia bacterium]